MALTGTTTPTDEKDLWSTPPEVFAALDARYGPFTLDAAANETNHKTQLWLGPGGWAEDALRERWANPFEGNGRTRVWCNPPYSRGMVEAFVAKAAGEVRAGRCSATLLIPATTEVVWWHRHVWDAARGRFRPGVEVEFWPRRIQFIRPDGTKGGNPPGGSVIVTFYG